MIPSTVYIASDHAGFELKEKLVTKLLSLDYQVENLGPQTAERVDYPDYANLVSESLKKNSESFGILVCGSGQGMSMRSNKFSHIRGALCWSEESAKLSRQHNNANILCLGARLLNESLALSIAQTFLKEEFEGGRHQLRVEKISVKTD